MTYENTAHIAYVLSEYALVDRISAIADFIRDGTYVQGPDEKSLRQMHRDLTASIAVLDQRRAAEQGETPARRAA